MRAEPKTLLVTGGCRSGKSACAMHHAEHCGTKRLFLATAKSLDTEMAERIQSHKARRGPLWTTVEEPNDPAKIIRSQHANYDVILLDCITLWLTNLLGEGLCDNEILERVDELCSSFEKVQSHIIMVTNETGWSIVPENALARRFRDLSGLINQRLAQAVAAVILTVAGIPVVVKGHHKAQPNGENQP